MSAGVDEFRAAIQSKGLTPPEGIEPNVVHRFPGVGKKNGNTAGWCVLFADGLGGCYGDWSTGLSEHWQAHREPPRTAAEGEAFRRRVEEAKARALAERKAKHEVAAQKAQEMWAVSGPAPADHPYLVKKQIKPHGIRVWSQRGEYSGLLMVPVRIDGSMTSLQFIDGVGDKRFLCLSEIKGGYYSIGTPDELQRHRVLCIAEGFATAATLREATDFPVIVAFHSGNLEPVARTLRAKHETARIIICADDDYRTPNNPGITKATEAAKAVNGLLAVPDFGSNRPDGATDFNDLYQAQGLEVVKRCVEAVCRPGERITVESPIMAVRSAAAHSMRLTPLAELFAEPEETVRWIVDGMLPHGGLSLLAGKPKSGKSTLARCLALHMATGTPWLGRVCVAGPVIYLALEEKRSEVRQHFQAMGAMGSELIYVYAASAPNDALVQVRALVGDLQPVLLIIDPLFKLTRVKDGNDYAAVTAALEPVLQLARQTGCHVLAVHHLGKGERTGGDSVLGSTAIWAAVDSLFLLKRQEQRRTLSSIQRYGKDLEETVLTFQEDTRDINLGEPKERAEMNDVKEAISAYLAGHPESLEAELADSVEGRTAAKRKALRELVASGQVTRTGKGGKKDPFRYSCFDVPNIYREQEKQEPENNLSSQKDSPDSCSEENGLLPGDV
jgi:putative DNA primase/helicase